MSICDSEENRKKLAWLVPGYILLAWFFCVLFQPLGIHNPARTLRNHGIAYDQHYDKVTYLLNDDGEQAYLRSLDRRDNETIEQQVCDLNGTSIVLEPGRRSAIIIRLGRLNYPYRQFNCSLQIEAGEGLDGLSAVVEEMDLREHEDDRRQPGGHWGSSVCVDYIEAYTDKSKVRNKLCGKWTVHHDDRLNSHGPHQTLVGYCYDDRSGHSCESKTIFLNVVIDGSDKFHHYGLNLRGRKGFSLVVTGYRHLKPNESECDEKEFQCPIHDFSLHDQRPHCIWKDFKCDSHQNCGFTYNKDEDECIFVGANGINGASMWSISTMTVLVVVYLGIVLVLVLVTMMLLRWHKALRTPLDVLADSRSLHTTDMFSTEQGDGSLTTEARTGTVSIIVSYRPQNNRSQNNKANLECPPSYDSIFLNDHPPNYSAVTQEPESEEGNADRIDQRGEEVEEEEEEEPPKQEGHQETSYVFRTEHCDCDCDHSNNAESN